MIKNIVFDLGDVFINLDKNVVFLAMDKYGGAVKLAPEMKTLNERYEVGTISSGEFIAYLGEIYPKASPEEIIQVWNSMLLDFPDERLLFLEALAKESQYRLFLLSNTNALHISHVRKIMGPEKFQRFKNCFETFYLSHEIHLRKPNADIYNFVLRENGLIAEETFFIDDTEENTIAAEKLGIRCWNLQVGKEDVIELKSKF